jgi:hypothetical protein
MSHLRELQFALQDHVLHGTATIVPQLRRASGLDVAARLAIYSNAYTMRLAEALRDAYPALAVTMGPGAFDELSRDYVATHASHQASIRWFGAQLAPHLRARGESFRADVARWEWTLGAVFDGPDAAPVGLAAATAVAAADWPTLRIAFCSNALRVAVRADAVQAWRRASGGNTEGSHEGIFTANDSSTADRHRTIESATTGCPDTTEWLVWRRGLVTSFRSLSTEEAWAFDAAREGATFSELCEGLASRAGADRAAAVAAGLLKQWLTDGCVASLTCAPA